LAADPTRGFCPSKTTGVFPRKGVNMGSLFQNLYDLYIKIVNATQDGKLEPDEINELLDIISKILKDLPPRVMDEKVKKIIDGLAKVLDGVGDIIDASDDKK